APTSVLAARRLADLISHDHTGDAEVNDKAGGVHQRGYDWRREDRRVHSQLLRDQRQYAANNAGPGTDRNDRQRNSERDLRIVEESQDREDHRAQEDAQQEAHPNLTADDPQHVPGSDLVDRE